MAKFLAQKILNGLRPADEAGEEALRKISLGELVQVEIKRPRNLKMHKLFWALMSLVWQNVDSERYPTVEDLVAAVEIYAGIRTRIELPNGTQGFIPGSIAFHKMDQVEFAAFFERVIDLVCTHFIPGLPPGDLRDELEQMVGLKKVA